MPVQFLPLNDYTAVSPRSHSVAGDSMSLHVVVGCVRVNWWKGLVLVVNRNIATSRAVALGLGLIDCSKVSTSVYLYGARGRWEFKYTKTNSHRAR